MPVDLEARDITMQGEMECTELMKAVVCHGIRDYRIEEVPKPRCEFVCHKMREEILGTKASPSTTASSSGVSEKDAAKKALNTEVKQIITAYNAKGVAPAMRTRRDYRLLLTAAYGASVALLASYLAGLTDSDGCLGMWRRRGHVTRYWCITQKNRNFLIALGRFVRLRLITGGNWRIRHTGNGATTSASSRTTSTPPTTRRRTIWGAIRWWPTRRTAGDIWDCLHERSAVIFRISTRIAEKGLSA